VTEKKAHGIHVILDLGQLSHSKREHLLYDENIRQDEADLGRIHAVPVGHSDDRHRQGEQGPESILFVD
jgi:hypothetical protein